LSAADGRHNNPTLGFDHPTKTAPARVRIVSIDRGDQAAALERIVGAPAACADADTHQLATIVERISCGDESALSELYGLLGGWVHGLARRILRSNECAQEIVCDVFVYVWKNAAAFDAARGTVRAWLAIATRHRAIDRLRSRRRHHLGERQFESVAGEFMRPEAVLAQFQDDTAVHTVLSSLSPLRRQLLALAFFDGLTHEEIAVHNGLPLGTVKSHIRRALKLMRSELDPR
jgi:RNA polymerase sigma-70 factor (ECF subfamily)